MKTKDYTTHKEKNFTKKTVDDTSVSTFLLNILKYFFQFLNFRNSLFTINYFRGKEF